MICPDILQLKAAYRFSRIINHFQNFHLIASYSKSAQWHIDLSKLYTLWTAGCIAKSKLLSQLSPVLKENYAP